MLTIKATKDFNLDVTLSAEDKIAYVKAFVADLKGKFFTVTFLKADGSERTMNCRTGVHKHLKGGTSTIAHKPNLVGVYEGAEESYKCFDASRVLSITSKGAELSFS